MEKQLDEEKFKKWTVLQTLCDHFYYDYTKKTFMHCMIRTDQSECEFEGCPGQSFFKQPVKDTTYLQ